VAFFACCLIDALERHTKLSLAGFEPSMPELQPQPLRLELSLSRIDPPRPLFEPCSGRFELSFGKSQAAFKCLNEVVDLEGMALIPKDSYARLSFFASRAEQWVERADEIGLSETSAEAIAKAVAAAKEARAEASLAAEAAKSATARANLADETLTRLGAAAIRTIKAFAVSQPNEADESTVYSAASLDRPQRPGPKRRTQGERDAAVPRISNVSATPDAHGNVRLRWETVRGATMGAGAGMSYMVSRRIDNGPEALIAMVGGPGPGRTSSTYLDDAVPIGTRSLFYTITPSQGGGVGTANTASVQFGRTPSMAQARVAA
jgi:hypothetical protein